jgi:hypothetical protein
VIPYADRTVSGWFDVGAFAAPNGFAFGNSGRDILTGPRLEQWDFSLFKILAVCERFRLQFRAESFDVFNHANFGLPNATIGTSSAGFTSSTVGSPRQNQFAFNFIF